MQAEVYEALRSIDISEAQALKAATALSQRDNDVAGLKTEVTVIKWMVGTGIGLTLILLGSVLTMWAKLGDISGQLGQIAKGMHG